MVGWPPIDSSQLEKNAVNNRALAPGAVDTANIASTANINRLFGDGSDGQVVLSADDAQGGGVYQTTEWVLEPGVTLGLSNAPLVVIATERIVLDGTVNGRGDGSPGAAQSYYDNETYIFDGSDGVLLGSSASVSGEFADGVAGAGGCDEYSRSGDPGGGPTDTYGLDKWEAAFHHPYSGAYTPLFQQQPHIAAGGGGGGIDTTQTGSKGGAGGDGGSGVLLVAPEIEASGTIDVSGTSGGNGNLGGGGGGGHGGLIGVFGRSLATGSLTTDTSGGAGGAGDGTRGDGGAGRNGPDVEVSL